MKSPTVKRGAEALADIRAAIERVAAKGKAPSLPKVAEELRRTRRYGASFETILPVLRDWKRETLERASGRIDAAIDAIVALRTRQERDEVRRLVEARTGGGIRVSFKQRGTPRNSGLPSSTRSGDTVRRLNGGGSKPHRPPTGSKS
jgi:hypothetical protein